MKRRAKMHIRIILKRKTMWIEFFSRQKSATKHISQKHLHTQYGTTSTHRSLDFSSLFQAHCKFSEWIIFSEVVSSWNGFAVTWITSFWMTKKNTHRGYAECMFGWDNWWPLFNKMLKTTQSAIRKRIIVSDINAATNWKCWLSPKVYFRFVVCGNSHKINNLSSMNSTIIWGCIQLCTLWSSCYNLITTESFATTLLTASHTNKLKQVFEHYWLGTKTTMEHGFTSYVRRNTLILSLSHTRIRTHARKEKRTNCTEYSLFLTNSD